VGTLRLLNTERTGEGHEGEIFSCAFAPDGSFVLSGGWDGQLRLWDTSTGLSLTALRASPKPLSCCAFAPDGKQLISGSMEGMLGFWDAVSHHPLQTFLAHTRPISSIRYAPNGEQLATSSWDRQIVLRKMGKEREGKTLSGHKDIVAGCRYTQDGSRLLSWSYDGTLRLWDAASGSLMHTLTGHEDRVTTAAITPDGQLAVSGGRDGSIKLWDLQQGSELASLSQAAEFRGCFCLADSQSVVAVDANGWMVLLSVPALEVQAELNTGLKVMCGDLAPASNQIALGGENGQVSLVALEGFEDAPLLVTATQDVKTAATFFTRLLGQTNGGTTYSYTCPACHQHSKAAQLPDKVFPCPQCRRRLRISNRTAQLQNQ